MPQSISATKVSTIFQLLTLSGHTIPTLSMSKPKRARLRGFARMSWTPRRCICSNVKRDPRSSCVVVILMLADRVPPRQRHGRRGKTDAGHVADLEEMDASLHSAPSRSNARARESRVTATPLPSSACWVILRSNFRARAAWYQCARASMPPPPDVLSAGTAFTRLSLTLAGLDVWKELRDLGPRHAWGCYSSTN